MVRTVTVNVAMAVVVFIVQSWLVLGLLGDLNLAVNLGMLLPLDICL